MSLVTRFKHQNVLRCVWQVFSAGDGGGGSSRPRRWSADGVWWRGAGGWTWWRWGVKSISSDLSDQCHTKCREQVNVTEGDPGHVTRSGLLLSSDTANHCSAPVTWPSHVFLYIHVCWWTCPTCLCLCSCWRGHHPPSGQDSPHPSCSQQQQPSQTPPPCDGTGMLNTGVTFISNSWFSLSFISVCHQEVEINGSKLYLSVCVCVFSFQVLRWASGWTVSWFTFCPEVSAVHLTSPSSDQRKTCWAAELTTANHWTSVH